MILSDHLVPLCDPQFENPWSREHCVCIKPVAEVEHWLCRTCPHTEQLGSSHISSLSFLENKKNLFLLPTITLTYTYNGAFDRVNHQYYQPFETEHHWKCSQLVWILQNLMGKKTLFHGGEGCLNHPSKPLEYPWDQYWTLCFLLWSSLNCYGSSFLPTIPCFHHTYLPTFIAFHLDLLQEGTSGELVFRVLTSYLHHSICHFINNIYMLFFFFFHCIECPFS